MSRVGKEPLPIPDGVAVTIDDQFIKVNGKLGELDLKVADGIHVAVSEGILNVSRSSEVHQQRALHGLTRALLANMVRGVSQGFKKDLEIVGVGYRCEMRGVALQLAVGFSHRVIVFPPAGVEFSVTAQTTFSISGIDNQLVGDTAAKIRAIRPPEPYKGKGIKYVGEHIRRKAGKAAGK